MTFPSTIRYCSLFILLIYAVPSIAVRHIVFIVADDLGWNDVGFRNPDMITPNIDKYAKQGVILNNAYVQPLCTPSRNAFMTGVYPFKAGLQRGVLFPYEARCASPELEYLPEKLQKMGYATHMAGKWHLGFCNWSCTPTYRGFDSFIGYYNGAEDYYNKTLLTGIDFWDNKTPILSEEYSPSIYAKRATDVIKRHDKTTPLFLYLPFQSVHAPIQVPKKYEDLYPNIKSDGRRQFCGMVTALDEAIGDVTDALTASGLINDTLIVFTTDNGGMPTEQGNNYPLRGGKVTVFEGGTRASAFIYGSGLKRSGYTYDGMMHAVDWNPTILAAAGAQADTDNMDGINMWEALQTGGESSRTEFIYNLDNDPMAMNGHAAIRVGDYKLIDGYPGPFSDWYKPDQYYENVTGNIPAYPDETEFYKNLAKDRFARGVAYDGDGLYNLKDDPNERTDLSAKFPDVVKQLRAKLDEYRKSLVPAGNLGPDPKSDPKNYGGYWAPGWC